MIYIATFKDKSGVEQSKELEATNELAARQILRRMGISPQSVTLTIKPEQAQKEDQVKKKSVSPNASREAEEKLAIEWAKSLGYPVPVSKVKKGPALALAILLFLVCIIPGIIFLVWWSNRDSRHDREMAALMTKWIDAGKPQSGEKVVLPGRLEVLPENKEQKTIEDKLGELASLREKGQISDEEYEAMRKKALGL